LSRGLQQIAAVTQLRPEKEAEYRRLHAAAWPGVMATSKEANISNYSMFLCEGMLFSYLEYWGNDYAADSTLIAADQTTQQWWKLTAPCQVALPSARRTKVGFRGRGFSPRLTFEKREPVTFPPGALAPGREPKETPRLLTGGPSNGESSP
jgi:L-rhamnose mutarotase